MINKNFKIKKGIYVVPTVGRVDAREEVSDEKAFQIYTLPRRSFPWISLTSSGASFLKKKKLKIEEIARLITQAQTEKEVELLAELSDSKTIERVKETKINALKAK